FSPPCKGASGLLSEKSAKTPKYRAMNGLALSWLRLMFAAWDDKPALVLLENVPRLKVRAGGMLRKLKSMLRQAGYVLHEGFHDCGELGGLAQRRRRYLLVARLPSKCPPILYQPPKRRVRGCGEVLSTLPIPEDPRGGPLHKLPNLSWLNWVRLALIPAGGDWRDLPGVLAEGESRREKFKRHRVEPWTEPTGTIGGSGSNGVENVADPRVALPCANNPRAHHNKYRVERWDEPAHTVIGATRPGSGAPACADPRGAELFGNVDRVRGWEQPAGTVTSSPAPSSGGGAVADPRPQQPWFGSVLGVKDWADPSNVVTGNARAPTGAFSVADPRAGEVKRAFDHGYAVLRYDEPSPTVAGGSYPGQGAYSVSDPRLKCKPRAGAWGVLGWREAAATITGHARVDNGRFAIGDPRKPPPFLPVIIAEDGTWHRPLTTLELAALQSIPTIVRGAPLKLAGNTVRGWRERIGNAVPTDTAEAIAGQMLVALLQAKLGAFALSAGAVWVRPIEIGAHA
ncbi:MAG: DNA cytosine methyltransferase, partial [Labilithrix sp.]|nr:DNA cytosine methyltransferase [Labilithrix sp.]